MTALAQSDITTTIISQRNIQSRQTETLVKLVFGNAALTYPSGGLPVPSDTSLGLKSPLRYLYNVKSRGLTTATEWEYDYANGTLRGYHNGHIPPFIVQEIPTLTGTTTVTGTLAYPPAYIVSACATISAAVTPLKIVPSTATAVAGELAVNFTTGAFTSFAETPTLVTVSYFPQQPAGFFAAANMVSESITLATGTGNAFTSRAACVQFAYQTTATAARLAWGHANASGVLLLDINNSGSTSVSANAAQNAKAATFQYLKYSGLPQPAVAFIDQASVTLTSEQVEFAVAAGQRKGGLTVSGTGTQIIGKEASNYLPIYVMADASLSTDGPGLATWNFVTQVLVTDETTAQTTLEDTPLLYINPLFFPQRTTAEFTTNDAPAATTLYMVAVA